MRNFTDEPPPELKAPCFGLREDLKACITETDCVKVVSKFIIISLIS